MSQGLKVPAIYLDHRSPHGSSILPSIVNMFQADNLQTMVYANLQLPEGTTRWSPIGWWSLTPPSHPYPIAHTEKQRTQGRLFSSTFTYCHQQLPFSEVGRPMLPGLSSRTLSMPAAEPGHCLLGCKYNDFLAYSAQLNETICYISIKSGNIEPLFLLTPISQHAHTLAEKFKKTNGTFDRKQYTQIRKM